MSTGIDAAYLVVLPGLVDTHVHINEPGRDGLGRLRARDARGGGRRRHDARRHAAQQHPVDDDVRRRSRRSGAPPTAAATSTSASGAASSRATRRPFEPLARRGRARLQVLSVRRRASTSSRTSAKRTCATALPILATTRSAAARPRGAAGAPARSGPAGDPAQLSNLARHAGRRRAKLAAIELMIAARARVGRTRSRRAPRRRPTALPAHSARARRAACRSPCETCPHYLTFDAERDCRRRDTTFKCAPPIRERDRSRRPVAGTGGRRDRSRRHRSLSRAAGAQASGGGRLPARVGRHRVAPARARRRVDRSIRPALAFRSSGALDGWSARRAGWSCGFEGCNR